MFFRCKSAVFFLIKISYDFDKNGIVSAEDVRLCLSYIPFRKGKSSSGKQVNDASDIREGLYDVSEGRNIDYKQRTQNQDEIKSFLDFAFDDENKNMTLEAFIRFNTDVSSEMFVSIMAILNERLPCAQFYFRQRRRFKFEYFQKNAPEPGMQQSI